MNTKQLEIEGEHWLVSRVDIPGDFFDPEVIAREDRRTQAWLDQQRSKGVNMARWIPGRRIAEKMEGRVE